MSFENSSGDYDVEPESRTTILDDLLGTLDREWQGQRCGVEVRKKEKTDKSQQKGRIEPTEMLLAGAPYGEDRGLLSEQKQKMSPAASPGQSVSFASLRSFMSGSGGGISNMAFCRFLVSWQVTASILCLYVQPCSSRPREAQF